MEEIVNHHMVTGKTGTGKTFLLKEMAKDWIERKRPVLVYDPGFSRWPCSEQYANIDRFYRRVKETRDCACFIDEAGTALGRFAGDKNFFASQGRHLQHRFYFIAQRYNMVDINTRTQCQTVITFRIGQRDANLLSEETACNGFKDAPNLPLYTFMLSDPEGNFYEDLSLKV